MKTIINVMGLQRSGTTMLSLMLAHGANAVACGEIAGWYRVARYREHAKLPDFWKFLEDVREDECHLAIFENIGVDFIIDSSKNIDWVIDVNKWGNEAGIRIINLLIFKNPVDQIYSSWKRKESIFKAYIRYLYYHLRIMWWSGLDFITISYDHLVLNPELYLKRICQYVGIPWFDGKERFWKGEYPPILGSNEGVKDQIKHKKSSIRKEKYSEDFNSVKRKISKSYLHRVIYNKLIKMELINLETIRCQGHRWRKNPIILLELYLRKLLLLLKRYSRS